VPSPPDGTGRTIVPGLEFSHIELSETAKSFAPIAGITVIVTWLLVSEQYRVEFTILRKLVVVVNIEGS
jgi:hypothetical protein